MSKRKHVTYSANHGAGRGGYGGLERRKKGRWSMHGVGVKKKLEKLYFQSTAPDRVDRVFKIYRTTALDQKLVKKTFKLVDETLRRRNLFEAGLL